MQKHLNWGAFFGCTVLSVVFKLSDFFKLVEKKYGNFFNDGYEYK